jgi:hypothetical protein
VTYFADLSAYSYRRETRYAALNVGWLDRAHAFPQEQPSEQLLDILWMFVCSPVNQTRGLHRCELCPRDGVRSNLAHHNGEQRLLGSAEIRAFAIDGTIYAAPTLVFHFVRQHQYTPPPEFVRALFEGPAPSTAAYAALISASRDRWIDSSEMAERRRAMAESVLPTPESGPKIDRLSPPAMTCRAGHDEA